ncbi:MAG: SpoIIIAH-like family protein [Firmicutes bacterium]|nr:SpoIIIAH-like family protein [Bacillota bacterium]
MLTKKKKIFVLTGMVALLVLTGVLNIVLNNRVDSPPVIGDGGGIGAQCMFQTMHSQRQLAREQQRLSWQAVIENSTDAETIATATENLARIDYNIKVENAVENIVGSKDFVENVHVMTAENDTITVMVRTTSGERPSDTEANLILDVVLNQTNSRAEHQVIVFPVLD